MPSSAPHALLLAAPPTGPDAWHEVERRLAHHGWTTDAVDLFDDDGAAALLRGGTAALVEQLADRAAQAVIVGHGLALPLALELAHRTSVAGLVLSNGPLRRVDSLTRLSARAARFLPLLTAAAFRPTALRAFLGSSAGMRRLVVNPYVMDRDMIVRITKGWTGDSSRRRAVSRWLAELPAEAHRAQAPGVPTLLAWADEDILYPAHIADSATGWMAGARHHRIPGARHLHLIERPWEIADLIQEHARPAPAAT